MLKNITVILILIEPKLAELGPGSKHRIIAYHSDLFI